MTLQTRRIIMIVFIATFIIAAPIIIFYTSGYRYNFKKGQIIKTGLFVIRTIPKDAEIYLDGILQKKDTLEVNSGYLRIDDLAPKNYNLEVKREGYLGWSKNIKIHANQTTFVKDIILFKKEIPWPIHDAQIKNIKMSPNKKYFALVANEQNIDKLFIYSTDTQNGRNIPLQEDKIDFLDWSPSSNKLLFSLNKNFLILNIDNEQITTINDIIAENSYSYKTDIKQVKWHESNDNIIYAANGRNLYELNLALSEVNSLADNQNISDFVIKDNKLLLLDNSLPNKSYLIRSNLNSLHRSTKTITLPHSDDYLFINSPSNYLQLHDRQNQIMYLFEWQKDDFTKPEEIISGVKNSSWPDKRNWILYYNDFEIWIYKVAEKDKTLLTRISKKIDNAIWLAEYPYVIFTADNQIKVLEEDGRDRRNLFELASFDKIDELAVNENGKNLFFSGKINDLSGLFILKLRD